MNLFHCLTIAMHCSVTISVKQEDPAKSREGGVESVPVSRRAKTPVPKGILLRSALTSSRDPSPDIRAGSRSKTPPPAPKSASRAATPSAVSVASTSSGDHKRVTRSASRSSVRIEEDEGSLTREGVRGSEVYDA